VWRAVSSWRDESDLEFVVWHVLAKSDDGRIRTVHVKMDKVSVDEHTGPIGGSSSSAARKVIETQGKSLVDENGADLAPSYVFGVGGFIAEWD